MMDQCCQFHPDPLASFAITTQSRSFWFKKIMGNCSFTLFSFFIAHFALLCSLSFNLLSMLVFLISQPCLTRFQWDLFYPLPYAHSTSLIIFRLKFIHNPTLEGTLHNRVKDFTIHNSVIICDRICKNLPFGHILHSVLLSNITDRCFI